MRNTSPAEDRRSRRRYRISLPLMILLGDREVPAYTRDVSNLGVYFFVDPQDLDHIEGEFQFLIEMPPEITLSAHSRVRCVGRVVRKEIAPNGPAGIAAKILEYSR